MKSYQIKDLLKDPTQLIFAVLATFTVFMLVPFTKAGFDFIYMTSKNMPVGYEFPDVSDLKITAIASVFFAVIEIVMRKVFYKMFIPYCKE